MRLFLSKLALFAVMQFVIAGVLIAFRSDDTSSDEYIASCYDKLRLLEQTPGPRLILVGGSGVAFGFDSGLLEQETGLRTINFGIHAGIPLEWYLNELAIRLRADDQIVVAPEYIRAGLDASGAISGETVRLLLLRPKSIRTLPWRLWRDLNPGATYASLPVNGVLRFCCLALQQGR